MTSAPPHTPAQWLQPISDQLPCGPSLEYDPDFTRLVSMLQPRGDAQYGEFIDSSEPPDWTEVERLCRELLVRTRDINLLVWLCRARVRTASALGLAQGLGMLADVLERWPRDVHPQAWIEGEPDPAMRANALAALCDPEGLLGDVRDIVISGNAMRLLVRDVERAFSMARPGATPEANAVRQQLHELRIRARGGAGTATRFLEEAACAAHRVQQWCTHHLQDDAPDLLALLRILSHFEPLSDPVVNLADHSASGASALSAGSGATGDWPDSTVDRSERSRRDVLQEIRCARQWFEDHEPSSPVAVLLRQAERMVGQRFAVVADAIPMDLLRKWDAEAAGETLA